MASYRYTVTIQEPARALHDIPAMHVETKPEPIVRSFDNTNCGTRTTPYGIALELAKSQHRRPDGTTVTITRASMRRTKRIVNGGIQWEATGPESPYRRYVVQGGFVRRVDR